MPLSIYRTYEYVHQNFKKRIFEDSFIPVRDVKILLKTDDNYIIECALYEIIKNDKRILHSCISTQIGCNNQCIFCHSGEYGFKRNLSSDEILSQIHQIIDNSTLKTIDDIALMGVGEPLDNISNIADAIDIARDNNLFSGVIRLSTVGRIKGIDKLNNILPNTELWVSLHSANEEKRRILMPQTQDGDLMEVIDVASNYAARTSDQVILQYLILHGCNDSIMDAKDLAKLLKSRETMFKIQFAMPNGKAFDRWQTTMEDIRNFHKLFANISSVDSKIFLSKGIEISAGCGELSIFEMSNF